MVGLHEPVSSIRYELLSYCFLDMDMIRNDAKIYHFLKKGEPHGLHTLRLLIFWDVTR